MVTFMVIGWRGMLGRVVARRWQELGAESGHDGYIVNCIRPDNLGLSRTLARTWRLIQPSTDAIAEDTEYARTKRELEAISPAVTIRSGIIDIDRQPTVAYRNWTCNGLTPLEWADLAWSVRDEPGVHVAGREPFTRYDAARLVAELWDRPAPIAAYAEEPLDRVQTTTEARPLAVALAEYRRWLRS